MYLHENELFVLWSKSLPLELLSLLNIFDNMNNYRNHDTNLIN